MEKIHLYLSAGGIGDAVCGLYAACGIANAGYDVVFQTHHQAWLQRCHHPRVQVEAHKEYGIDLNRNYEKQLEVSNSRKDWYCDNVSDITGHGIGAFRPSSPKDIDRHIHNPMVWPSLDANRKKVLFVPFTAGRGRDWHETHWLRLMELCIDEGYAVAAMDSHLARLRGLFDRASHGKVSYFAPERIDQGLDAILSASVIVGLDSGMAHVAALHNVPAIALMSIYPAWLVFSHTKVHSMMPQTNCAGCRGLYERGYRYSCKQGCSAMLTITPDEVFEQVKGVIGNGG